MPRPDLTQRLASPKRYDAEDVTDVAAGSFTESFARSNPSRFASTREKENGRLMIRRIEL
jgi:hypothetical protein